MAAGYGVAVAGGFDGEYAMNGLDQPFSSQATGILTTDKEAITNYVELFQHRSSASPYAAFASNDSVMRVFDVKTNTLVSTQPYSFAVNCTATSPDGRLRLIVGDEPTTHIVDSDTGLSLRELQGHKDHGFACAWSPCGTQIATGNQDGTIQVWDTRNWRRLAVIASDVAGYRSLTFSPPVSIHSPRIPATHPLLTQLLF
jgi:WD40 repeat protein